MNISGRHSNSNFAHSFHFHCLTNFSKSINFSYMGSLWRALLYKLTTTYTFKSDHWIAISWANFELEYLIYSFTTYVYSTEFKVTWKNGDFECRYIRIHTEEKQEAIFSKRCWPGGETLALEVGYHPRKKKKKKKKKKSRN